MRFRIADVEDRQRAFQDLLDNVAVTAALDATAFRRIKRFRNLAHQWFSSRAGWGVIVERDFARLLKSPARHRPAGEFARIQSPRDYEMLMWVLWYGEKLGRGQFLLTVMAEEIAGHANVIAGERRIDWKERAQRYTLLRAVDALLGAGALVRYDGEIEQWASGQEGDVLYEFTDLALRIYTALPGRVYEALVERGDASVLAAGTPVPMVGRSTLAGEQPTAERPAVDGERPAPIARGPAMAGERRGDLGDEERLYRALLLEPALYRFRDPAAFAVLSSPDRRRRILDDLAEHLGWDLEITPNYVAVVRPSAARQRRTFPRAGTVNHVALLVAGRIRDLVERGELEPTTDDRVPLSRARLESALIDVRDAHGGNWSAAFRERPLTEQFAETVAVMREWGLIEGPDAHDRFAALPLAGRFRAIYTNREDALSGGESDE